MMKEFGSDFHYYNSKIGEDEFFKNQSNFNLFFSGRAAIYNLLKLGIAKYGWEKIGFPSYYCHEVIDFCRDLDIEILLYSCNPLENDNIELIWEDDPKSAIVNVNYFGIRKADFSKLNHTIIIEDVTHDLLSIGTSSADYFFGSLRKQLPIGVGGFCKIKDEDELLDGAHVTPQAIDAYQKKLLGMFLKSEYLNNNFKFNTIYREYFQDAEKMFENKATNSIMPNLAEVYLKMLPIEELIRKTYENISIGIENIIVNPKYKILNKSGREFCLIIYCESSQIKNSFKQYLIDNKIFPATLWPHQINDRDIEIENKIICIHMDFRYSTEEVVYISNMINSFFEDV